MTIETLIDSCCHKSITNGEYFIWDNPETKKGEFINETDSWTLKVTNSTKEDVHFVQVEDCIMNQSTKQCDWVLFDDGDFYFVEAKDVRPASRKKERANAKEKFTSVVKFFEQYKNSQNRTKFAVLNFRSSRLLRAASQANLLWYQKELGLEYLETNYLEFN